MSTNSTAVDTKATAPKQQITQTREQLSKLLERERTTLKEVQADIKAIVALVKEFKEKVGIPETVTLMWAISNRKAIFALIQNIVKVLKTKNAI